MNQVVRELEAKSLKQDVPDFRPGDTVRVSVRIVEGDKERLQDFEGICIRRKSGGIRETFTLRRVSYGVGMERIFPLHSPRIENIQVVRKGKVRRAKLYYLRDRKGKKARISERQKQYEGVLDYSTPPGDGTVAPAPAGESEQKKSES